VADRFFNPNSMIWRVDQEMALLVGGGRALLMQLAHPKVASGVADHSRFKEDPMGRLHSTMNTMWSIVFDERARAQASLERVKDVHKRVRGTIKHGDALPAGTPYDALDPDLLLWVHATLVDSAMLTYDLFVSPLSKEDKAHYYSDSRMLGQLFEIPESKIPASLEAFNVYIEEMIGGNTISVDSVARDIAGEILHPRPLLLKIGGPLFAFITTGLLPQRLREAYGLAWDRKKERRLHALAALVRFLLPILPQSLRVVPQARAAQKSLA
jgi:uncharacterized protein (DUF2236 family)